MTTRHQWAIRQLAVFVLFAIVATKGLSSAGATVTVTFESAGGRPGEQVELRATLQTDEPVAGVEIEVSFDSTATAVAVREDGRPDCVEEPSIRKNASGFAFRPARCDPFDRGCNAMRALVVATDNTDAIPSGSTLFRCRVDIAFDAVPGTYRFKSKHALYSPPEGADRALEVADLFLAVGGPPLATPTMEPSPTAKQPGGRGGGSDGGGCQLGGSDATSANAWPISLVALLLILLVRPRAHHLAKRDC